MADIANGPTRARRRQWGAERRSEPLSIVHPRPSSRAIAGARVAIVATVGFWAYYLLTTIVRLFVDTPRPDFTFTMEAIGYAIVVTFLTFSASMYLLARLGAMYRYQSHVRVPRGELDRHFGTYQHGITVLVPSYAEETHVVRATLWSAALQEFPDLGIVLLLDDAPFPTDPETLRVLNATRALAGEIGERLAAPAARFRLGAERRLDRFVDDPRVTAADVRDLADDYAAAAAWLEEMAAAEEVLDHVDEFFVDQVIMGVARELRLSLLALESSAAGADFPDADQIVTLSLRLARIFTARLDYFERKKYASLSHEANKAMNLNSYIGLMGTSWVTDHTAEGTVLRRAVGDAVGDFPVPDTEYLLTLDADSLLLRDYCVRLVHLLEEPENARVAVTQTPYSSFHGAPTRIERIAGASTDLQHMLHQGMTYFDATFWVGANAVIRKKALEDIVEVEEVGGFEIRTYIQDRTVIEDTESSIDLGTHGWTLVNYPERLSYSATPPDFGSLIVQRRRWANGGLLILPKFWDQLRERRFRRERVRWSEVFLRTNYMASIAWSSFGLIFLLAFPYDSRLLSPFVFLAALPYFLAMGTDLRDAGHRFSDVFRIYGFNLVLLPVNLAGVLKSFQQMFSAEKIPFVRTPKVLNRTAAPALYVIVPYLIVAFSLLTLYRDISYQNVGNAIFAAFNAVATGAAILMYIGLWNSVVDVWLGLLNFLYVDVKKPKQPAGFRIDPGAPVDWQGILYHGDRRLNRDSRTSRDRRRRIGVR
ncbi:MULTISPECIES: glycosyltransferase family 2 protein [unclassified Cryobacterium]|uniref:glycosyltransferase family 2 protein n=1 Tax=unclassified Cryobacterium TaxID=2649013 RepID=UPI002AB3E6DA|nr:MULTISPECIES: glycosyltransferase family 2 protein [unclassified Cryobacterium]MDY7542532.1 glycosyltransferase family 2 protein [Cryobacterium sp. 5B3]MEB0266313.1 glycosyltransferase family 2 protein [Cryobacterium sp. 10I5]MEB0274520.1 glycosyltransferase family 2 protein [Cryobacterium sp. 5B3]